MASPVANDKSPSGTPPAAEERQGRKEGAELVGTSGVHRYKKLRVIGSGTYGKVYKVKCLGDGEQYVMKRVTLAQNSEEDRKQAMKEVEVLSALKHPHIVPYRECFWDEEEMDLCMVMSYCEGGDLYHYVQSRRKQGRKIEEEEAWLFMIQMMFALAYLHQKKILHRDVKSQNIFLSKGRCLLGDFGLAKQLEESFELARTPIGTPFYMAPEIMEGRPYAFKSDVWALGCVMYEVLTGKPAFAAKNFPGVAMKVLRGHYEPIAEDYSEDLRSIVSRMLCNNVNSRPFIFQLIEDPGIAARAHAYLSDLELEQMQAAGLMGTWRGAIPITTLNHCCADGLLAIPEGEVVEAEVGGETGAPMLGPPPATYADMLVAGDSKESKVASPKDGSCGLSSSLLACWRAEEAAESPDVQLATSLEKPDLSVSGAKTHTLTAAAGTIDIGDLSIHVSSSTLPAETAQALHSLTPLASTASARAALTLPPHLDPFGPKDNNSPGMNEDSASPLPLHGGRDSPKLLASSNNTLSEADCNTLRGQLEQMAAFADCVRQTSICAENSGDLSDAPGMGLLESMIVQQESDISAPLSDTQPGADFDVSSDVEKYCESSEYESDFEEDEDGLELSRSFEWKEQQKRRDVQRLWNIEAAEAVQEDIGSVALTPLVQSSDDNSDCQSDKDVTEESVPGSRPQSSQNERTMCWRGPALRKARLQSAARQRMEDREQRLRSRCISGLGEAVYARLYNFLQQRAKLYSDDDDVALRVELSEFLEDSQMAYWPLVDELVYFDQGEDAGERPKAASMSSRPQ